MNRLTEVLLNHQHLFHETVAGSRDKSRTCSLDLSRSNPELLTANITDTDAFSQWIDQQLRGRIGWGGYLEHREIYRRSRHFDSPGQDRSLHLGIDIWTISGTAVFCPVDGRIHSFADNAGFGNYGPTLILEHELESVRFYTLYGHLSRGSLRKYEQGSEFQTGSCLGYLGTEEENGSWPPHLHFQIIEKLDEFRGDYPGVAKPSEEKYFRNNCPDPNLILQCP